MEGRLEFLEGSHQGEVTDSSVRSRFSDVYSNFTLPCTLQL